MIKKSEPSETAPNIDLPTPPKAQRSVQPAVPCSPERPLWL